ncbi:MAG: TSUP family transporter [Thermodesulfobacteriota bacterium]
MEYLAVCLAALAASGLTLFSGFGLGTLLMPVFAVFFPVEVAVAQTAAVHFANNLFKLALFGRRADRGVLLRFGLPAILASFAGAALLLWLSHLPPLAVWDLGGRACAVHPVKLTVAALMLLFSLVELWPGRKELAFARKWLPLGGLLSGFFGGLSGHQGAFRSAFLVRAGLAKEAFIGSGVAIACLVDMTRLAAYADLLDSPGLRASLPLVGAAALAAFLGAFIGSRLVRKITIRALQLAVAAMLLGLSLLLGAGVI